MAGVVAIRALQGSFDSMALLVPDQMASGLELLGADVAEEIFAGRVGEEVLFKMVFAGSRVGAVLKLTTVQLACQQMQGHNYFNPLHPDRTNSSCIAKISILK